MFYKIIYSKRLIFRFLFLGYLQHSVERSLFLLGYIYGLAQNPYLLTHLGKRLHCAKLQCQIADDLSSWCLTHPVPDLCTCTLHYTYIEGESQSQNSTIWSCCFHISRKRPDMATVGTAIATRWSSSNNLIDSETTLVKYICGTYHCCWCSKQEELMRKNHQSKH